MACCSLVVRHFHPFAAFLTGTILWHVLPITPSGLVQLSVPVVSTLMEDYSKASFMKMIRRLTLKVELILQI